MKKNKAETYLGFGRKAGKVVSGYHKCLYMITKKSVKLIILADDVSQNTKDKFFHQCKKAGIPCVSFGTIESLSQVTSNEGRGVYGLTDGGLAQAIIKEIDND